MRSKNVYALVLAFGLCVILISSPVNAGEQWSTELDSEADSLVVDEETIYVLTDTDKLYVVSNSGGIQNTHDIEGADEAYLSNGELIVSTGDSFYTYQNNQLKRIYTMETGKVSTKVIQDNGAYIFGTSNERVKAVGNRGSNIWKFDEVHSNPTDIAFSNGNIYVLTTDGIYRYNEVQDRKIWGATVRGWYLSMEYYDSSIYLFSDDVIEVESEDGENKHNIYDGDGSQIKYSMESGDIYMLINASYITRFSLENNESEWRSEINGNLSSNYLFTKPIVTSDAVYYVSDTHIHKYDKENGDLIDMRMYEDILSTTYGVVNGKILFPSTDSNLSLVSFDPPDKDENNTENTTDDGKDGDNNQTESNSTDSSKDNTGDQSENDLNSSSQTNTTLNTTSNNQGQGILAVGSTGQGSIIFSSIFLLLGLILGGVGYYLYHRKKHSGGYSSSNDFDFNR